MRFPIPLVMWFLHFSWNGCLKADKERWTFKKSEKSHLWCDLSTSLEWIVAWSENLIGKESIVNHCSPFDLTLIHFFWFQAPGCRCKFSSSSSFLCSVSASEFFSQQVSFFSQQVRNLIHPLIFSSPLQQLQRTQRTLHIYYLFTQS